MYRASLSRVQPVPGHTGGARLRRALSRVASVFLLYRTLFATVQAPSALCQSGVVFAPMTHDRRGKQAESLNGCWPHPLIPLTTMPWMKTRWNRKKITTTGMVASSESAMRRFHCVFP